MNELKDFRKYYLLFNYTDREREKKIVRRKTIKYKLINVFYF